MATIDYLLVAGGGGGGGSSLTSPSAAGGGGGEVVSGSTNIPVGSYPVVIGEGGVGGSKTTNATGTIGNDTTFNGLTAHKGGPGGGATREGDGLYASWGGFANTNPTNGVHGPYCDFDPGNAGSSSGPMVAGGGAGDGGHGGNGGDTGGPGGAGTASSISGTPILYGGGGGGGGGGGKNGGSSDCGGGGGNTGENGANATANRGGGGGGGSALVGNGGNGGSGVAVISYPTGSIFAAGGTITYAGGNTIHTFTANGTFVVFPSISVSDTLAITESLPLAGVAAISLFDSLSISEMVTAIRFYNISAVDVLIVGETVQAQNPILAGISTYDSLAVTDVHNVAGPTLFVVLIDTLSISEDITSESHRYSPHRPLKRPYTSTPLGAFAPRGFLQPRSIKI